MLVLQHLVADAADLRCWRLIAFHPHNILVVAGDEDVGNEEAASLDGLLVQHYPLKDDAAQQGHELSIAGLQQIDVGWAAQQIDTVYLVEGDDSVKTGVEGWASSEIGVEYDLRHEPQRVD